MFDMVCHVLHPDVNTCRRVAATQHMSVHCTLEFRGGLSKGKHCI